MSYALYVTHPQVVQDPATPVPQWGLSDLGRRRAEQFANHTLARSAVRIVSSPETKALDLATVLAEVSGAAVEIGEHFAENDRTSTGFLPQETFEKFADAFFARPDESNSGWETARAAQRRIVTAFEGALVKHDVTRPLVFTGHGAVGTLLKCHLGNRPISRDEDQRCLADPGGGNVFVVRLADRALLTDWLAMEALPEAIAGL